MNPPATETASLPIDPATLAAMQSAAIDALPPRPAAGEAEKADQRAGALAFLAALRPTDPVQAMLALHIVASHYAAMEYFRRAARDDMPIELHLRTVGKAVALCRMLDRAMRDLAGRQGTFVRRPGARPAVLPASGPAVRAQPAHEAAQVSTPQEPPVAENRQERRRRERAERHLAAVGRRAGVGPGALANAMQERLQAELAARAAAPAVAVAA
jgi:hypothetical protein